MPWNPFATKVNPRTAPMILCVPDIGRRKNVAIMFQTALPNH